MELTTSYLLKAAITLLLLYLLYYALLRTQVNFRFNRLYLLLAPVLAITLPLMEWSASLPPETAVGEVLQSFQLDEIIIITKQSNAAQVSPSFFSLTSFLIGIYGLGVLLLFSKLLKQLWQVQQLKRQAKSEAILYGTVHVYQLVDCQATFAFGKAIFIGKQNHLSAADQDKILAHELAHVQLFHSWDILYYEVLTALVWFNPIIWLLKQELRDVHEYQADARVLQKYPTAEYSNLLSREALQHMGLPIGSYFQKPQVLKRLQMLQLNGQRSGWLRPLLILPALSILLFIFSLQAGAQVADLDLLPTEIPAAAQLPEQPAEVPIQESILPEPATEGLSTATPSQTQPALEEEPQKVEPASTPTFIEVPEINQTAPAIEEKPYSFVQQMPEFEGGDIALVKYLGSNISYPEAAKAAGTEGMVIVGFTIDTAGNLANYEILRGVSDEIDAEAMRIIKTTAGKWTPGSQNGRVVPVKYTLPIVFKIE